MKRALIAILCLFSASSPVLAQFGGSTQIIGGTDGTAIGNDGDKARASSYQGGSWTVTSNLSDTSPATVNVTAQDVATVATTMANSQVFYTGTPTASSSASFALSSIHTVKIQVTGTWTGTLQAEQSFDSGTTWVIDEFHQIGSPATTNSFTNNFIGEFNCSGATNIRVRATAAWTGTATVKIVETLNEAAVHASGSVTANAGTNLNTSSLALDTTVSGLQVSQGSTTSGEKGPLVQGAVTTSAPSYSNGQTSPFSLSLAGGHRVDLTQVGDATLSLGQNTMANSVPVVVSSNQTDMPVNVAQFGDNDLSTGTGGSGTGIPRVTVANDSTSNANPWIETPVDGQKATYSASITGLVTATTPTDIFTLTGSGTKTVRILRVWFSATSGTSAVRDILFIKRSSANSGGTSTNPTRVPHDSTSAAATATINAYTVNPISLGSAVGTLLNFKYVFSSTNLNTLIGLGTIPIDYGNRPDQAIVVRGTSEVFAINLNSVTSVTDSIDITIEWTEE